MKQLKEMTRHNCTLLRQPSRKKEIELKEHILSKMRCQIRDERIVFSGPNTNTTTIRFQKFGQIQILFEFRISAEYEYEYHLGSEIWPNTNIIRSATFIRIRIRILRLFEYTTEYEYE